MYIYSLYLLAPEASLEVGNHVAIVHADGGHERTLHTSKAGDKEERSTQVVIPSGQMMDSHIGNECDTGNKFHLGGDHARSIGFAGTENLDAGNMDDALEDAEYCHGDSKQGHAIAPTIRHDGEDEDEDCGDESAAAFILLRDLTLEDIGCNQIEEAARIMAFFPLVQDEKERAEHGKLLDNGQVVCKEGNQRNEEHGDYGVNLQCIVFKEMFHTIII